MNDVSYASDPVIKQDNFDKDAWELGIHVLVYGVKVNFNVSLLSSTVLNES